MNPIAFCIKDFEVTWNTFIRVIGLLAAFSLELSLVQQNGRKREIAVLIPFQLIFSFLIGRLLYFDCNIELFENIKAAFSTISLKLICFDGIVIGCALAPLVVKLILRKTNLKNLYDVSAPAVVLFEIIIRISQYFGIECRSWIIIDNPKFQKLPFAAPIQSASGVSEYHGASFLFDAVVLAGVLALSLLCFFKCRKEEEKVINAGHCALLTLTMIAVSDIFFDSTRYDAAKFRFNGFISQTQIVYSFVLIAIFVFYVIWSSKRIGFNIGHVLLIAMFLVPIAGAGGLEYCVQRYGEYWKYWYLGMAVCLTAVAFSICLLYRSAREETKKEIPDNKSKVHFSETTTESEFD